MPYQKSITKTTNEQPNFKQHKFPFAYAFYFHNNRQTDSHIEYNQYNFTNAYFQAVSIQGRTDKKKLSDNAKLQSKIESLRYASG